MPGVIRFSQHPWCVKDSSRESSRARLTVTSSARGGGPTTSVLAPRTDSGPLIYSLTDLSSIKRSPPCCTFLRRPRRSLCAHFSGVHRRLGGVAAMLLSTQIAFQFNQSILEASRVNQKPGLDCAERAGSGHGSDAERNLRSCSVLDSFCRAPPSGFLDHAIPSLIVR